MFVQELPEALIRDFLCFTGFEDLYLPINNTTAVTTDVGNIGAENVVQHLQLCLLYTEHANISGKF